MTRTHTPSPWKFNTDADIIESSDERQLAAVYGPKAEAHANARLIAAAPDLVETLDALVQKLDMIAPNIEAAILCWQRQFPHQLFIGYAAEITAARDALAKAAAAK